MTKYSIIRDIIDKIKIKKIIYTEKRYKKKSSYIGIDNVMFLS